MDLSPAMSLAVLKKKLESAVEERKAGFSIIESLLEKIERNLSSGGDEVSSSELRFIERFQCFRDSSFSGNRFLEEEKEVERFLETMDRSNRKRFCGEDDDDLSSKYTCLESIRREEEYDEECRYAAVLTSSDPFLESTIRRRKEESDAVFVEPDLKSGQQSKRKRSFTAAVKHTTNSELPRQVEEDKFSNDAVFYKPWLDIARLKRPRFVDHEAPLSSSSPSQEEVIALTLLQLSRDQWPTPTQTHTHTHMETETQPQSQTQTQQKTPLKFDSYKCGKEFSSYQAFGGQQGKPPQPHVETQTQTQTHSQRQQQTQTLPKFGSYKCSVCGKELTSFQALGGHKAGHRVKSPQPLVENANADGGDQKRQKLLLPSGKIHKCSICHIVFPTGPALGGHKRRHYEGILGSLKHSQDQSLRRSDNVVNVHKRSENNGSVVTNVSDPKQSIRRLIDLNNHPEFDESSGGNVEEVESVILLANKL